MKTSVVYLHVVAPNAGYDSALDIESGSYESNAQRFINSYRSHPACADHELVIVFTNGLPPSPELYSGLDCRFLFYKGPAWCTGVHQWAAHQLDSDFALFSSARTLFWKEGWLKRLVEAREKHGDGFYGTMSSNEARPHLRTNFYGVNPELFRAFPHKITTREETWRFESGDWNASHEFAKQGQPSMLVTWDGEYQFPDWRKPDNIFRRGDQSNLLVFDRHTQLFFGSIEEERGRLSRLSDGG